MATADEFRNFNTSLGVDNAAQLAAAPRGAAGVQQQGIDIPTQDSQQQPAPAVGSGIEIGGQYQPVLEGLPVTDFTDRDRAEIALQGMIADAHEKRDRVDQAKTEIQYPAIERSIKTSQDRADAVLRELQSAREQLNQPAPTLEQGRLTDTDYLASVLGILLNPQGAGQTLEAMGQYRDKQNQVKYQNQMNQFNLTRENVGQLVDTLQKQYGLEYGRARDLEDFLLKTQAADTQQRTQNEFVAGQNRLKEQGDEREKAWGDFYRSDNEGEVRAAAARLRTLDPTNAPSDKDTQLAVNAARGKREKAALDYFNATVQKVVDQYQGVVPDNVANDLRGRIQAIAQQFDVDPKLFGDLPTSAYWKRQLEEQTLQAKKEEWGARLSFMQEKEANDVLVDQARIEVAKNQVRIAQQNANTSSARLAWQKLKDLVGDSDKKLSGKRQSEVLNLRAKEAQLRSLRADKAMLPFDRNRKVAEVQAAIAGIKARIQTIDQLMATGKDALGSVAEDPVSSWQKGDPVPSGYEVVPMRRPDGSWGSGLQPKAAGGGNGAKSGTTKSGVKFNYTPGN